MAHVPGGQTHIPTWPSPQGAQPGTSSVGKIDQRIHFLCWVPPESLRTRLCQTSLVSYFLTQMDTEHRPQHRRDLKDPGPWPVGAEGRRLTQMAQDQLSQESSPPWPPRQCSAHVPSQLTAGLRPSANLVWGGGSSPSPFTAQTGQGCLCSLPTTEATVITHHPRASPHFPNTGANTPMHRVNWP